MSSSQSKLLHHHHLLLLLSTHRFVPLTGQSKIRCDKDWPCSNCRIANRSCTSTGAGQRPKEHRQRVLISSQYERKIDQIENRLGSIESLLRNLSLPAASAEQAKLAHTPQTVNSGSGSNGPGTAADFDSSDDESVMGPESGLAVHSTFASDFLERVVQKTSLPALDPKMETALTNLRQFVGLQKRRSAGLGPRFPFQQPVPQGGVTKLPMPPQDLVLALLEHDKTGPPSLFAIVGHLVAIDDFLPICRSVYSPTEEVSDTTFLIANTMLYNLFAEQSGLAQDPRLKKEYETFSQMCRTNLETTLANLPLFLSPKIENLQALLLCTLYSVDISRPTIALHIITMGAWLCRSGNFHRKEFLKNDPPALSRIKRLLFWHVYNLSNALGLRLGQTSSIPECDIDIPRNFEEVGFNPLAASLMTVWIQLGWLQNQIYSQLYSSAAMTCSQAELIGRALVLAEEWSRIEMNIEESRERLYRHLKVTGMSDVVGVFARGDIVQFYVAKTLIYRVMPAPEGSISRFCDECLEAARKTMSTHHECIRQMNTGVYFRSIYIHWNLLSTPFAPFFVLFCYVIETSSHQDLKILQDFVDSLEPARNFSEPVDKLYRLCQAMCDVAVVYMEAKSQQLIDGNSMAIGDEFDMYLSQLGFMPAMFDQTMAHANDGNIPMQAGSVVGAQIAQYADWFSGSRNMMGLIEEDLSQIDSFRWMQMPDQM